MDHIKNSPTAINRFSVAVLSTATAGLCVSAGMQNLFFIMAASLGIGWGVIFFLSRHPINMYRPVKPEDMEAFDKQMPIIISYCIASVICLNTSMLFGALGLIHFPGASFLHAMIGNVSALLVAVLVYAQSMPDWKRWVVTMCSYALVLCVNIVCFSIVA